MKLLEIEVNPMSDEVLRMTVKIVRLFPLFIYRIVYYLHYFLSFS